MSKTVAQMSKLTDGLPSKSEKMRVLANAGYSRGDIARYLGTSYQFVRNVLVREEARGESSGESKTSSDRTSAATNANAGKVRLGSEGQITIPASIQRSLGLKEGDTLFIEAKDGELRLLTIPAAVRRAQAIVRQFIPADVSLVDELLEDRRREVEREQRND